MSFDYPLHIAVIQNRLNDLHVYFQLHQRLAPAARIELVNRPDGKGNTALHYAAAENRVEFIAPLLSNGANIDAQNNEGETALFQSVQRGNLSVVSLLCEQGADVQIANIRNLFTPLHQASCLGRSDIAVKLLMHGASMFALDDEEDTPLHWAVREERCEFARTMFDYLEHISVGDKQQLCAALVNFRNSDGESPLDLACCFGLKEMMALMETKLQGAIHSSLPPQFGSSGCAQQASNDLKLGSRLPVEEIPSSSLGFSFLISGAQQFLNGQNRVSVR